MASSPFPNGCHQNVTIDTSIGKTDNFCIDREQVELCVDILQRILMACSPLHVVQNYRAELQAGLTHPNDIVKILTLTQVTRL